MKDFNNQQRDFVKSMGQGFREDRQLDNLPLLVGGLVAFILLVAAITYISKNWFLLRAYFQFFFRKLKGEPVKDFRFFEKAEVVIQMPFGPDHIQRANTRNISRNGMYVKMNPPLHKGEIFQFLLVLDENVKIKGKAEVVWVQERWSASHPTGMGCRFTDLSESEKNKIQLFLRS